MGQETETAGGATAGGRPGPAGPVAPMTPPGGHRPPTGGFPAGPRSPYAQHPYGGPAQYPAARPYPGPYVPGPRPTPTGPHGAVNAGPYSWDPANDVDDPRRPGNAAAASSVILGLLALLISFRPLAFGSMVMAWDTYVALGVAVVALVVGGVALRTPVRRPVAVVGMTLSVLALLVVAVLPTI
ncbi:hypothetical protein LQ327_25525 [Actinomycetospora endophytica]|uniref:Uncharacterized protein n=1 Tax=Actinomycetospora endophytica TaxID=2291215 RepID=A0ABS8PEN6_9PSEU|nr:hypothetical protein [Actinomycetospora endophytica]MCD2196735.1 hypothetical protein [Actinomycetospora endophytica]